MKTLAIAVTASVALLLTACGDGSEDIEDREPDIRGEIADIGVDDSGNVVSVFVQGDGDAFFLRVDEDTDVFRLDESGKRTDASREDLALGQQVDAWSVGAINPSEPPQGNAGQIVITGRFAGDPAIHGEITEVSQADGHVTSVLVEGKVEPNTEFDKASLRVDDATEVLRVGGHGMLDATRDDLARGQQVEAWIVGPVAESYPVQGYAGRIVILGD